jgi:hypothetical protein
MSKLTTHKSLHSSGDVNMDYSGDSGTQHYHASPNKYGHTITWKDNPYANGRTLYKDSDGVWRYEDDDSVFRGNA